MGERSFEFEKDVPEMTSLQGCFLMAAPDLLDPNFYRSVVLLVQHDEEGAFGLVLNKPTRKTVREVWEQLGREECAFDGLLYLGGPVTGPLMVLHDDESRGDAEVLPGVYVTASKEGIDSLVESPPARMRVFTCYSGWGAKQLESELDEGAWIVVPATVELVFLEDEDLWDRLGKEMSRDFLESVFPPDKLPEDPSLN